MHVSRKNATAYPPRGDFLYDIGKYVLFLFLSLFVCHIYVSQESYTRNMSDKRYMSSLEESPPDEPICFYPEKEHTDMFLSI